MSSSELSYSNFGYEVTRVGIMQLYFFQFFKLKVKLFDPILDQKAT